ncbi:rhomboid family protein [Nitzschia inconspicua]|uniref:rhomboid protease n=1 Tax=Nitzschia inconspicua TaxID=303405 RepID=A0A9K3KJR0_9STRA|nr:rhomboid family protein [Nitzschia inconspicua]
MTSSSGNYYNQDQYDDEESSRGNGKSERKWYQSKKAESSRTQTPNYGTSSNANQQGLLSEDEEETQIYVVKQRYGVLSILFSVAQTVVLIVMMIQCGVAPLNINPMIGPYPDALSEWGAKNAVFILDDGEWWRFITPIFLHAGVIHLASNVFIQLETGAFFEREWGSITWLIVYLVSAVGSSALSVVAMPDAISVGSSGAVMGLFGAKGAEVIARCCESNKTDQDHVAYQVRKEQCAGVMCSVTIVMLFSFIPYVDWAAHLGGLLAGFCAGMILFAIDLKRACLSKFFWLLVGVALTVVYFVVVFQRMYSGNVEYAEELRDVCGYYKQFFDDYECKCQLGEGNQH